MPSSSGVGMMFDAVLVVVRHSGVEVGVLVDEVDRPEQFAVGEDLVGGPDGDDPVILREHDAPVGEQVEMSRSWVASYDRLARPVQLADELRSATAACAGRAPRSARRTAAPRGS